jgi:HD superfamily phosphohydrolase
MAIRDEVDGPTLRAALTNAAPQLWGAVNRLAAEWTAPIIARLDRRTSRTAGFPKTFNDPVWGVIELLPRETVLLDSPLMQRLRGVRQLGMAHTVYPGANHDRLEHSRGVVEAADRMLRALARNADNRRSYGRDRDESIPAPSDADIASTRIGALLHDIGHGPFSHVTERLLRVRNEDEFDAVTDVLLSRFAGVTRISTAETIAVLTVMSEAMRAVFEHPNFDVPGRPADLAPAVAARIIGSRSCLDAAYLSGVVSGPVDADKLDYMARDSHHSGLPLGLDIVRLISKLEVVTVTQANAPNQDLHTRATANGGRFYEMGISLSGLGAYVLPHE